MSSRIIFLTTHITAVIMLTSYSASLVSCIMTRVYTLPFHSFEEFLEDGTHQLAVEPYSSQITYFKVQLFCLVSDNKKSFFINVIYKCGQYCP